MMVFSAHLVLKAVGAVTQDPNIITHLLAFLAHVVPGQNPAPVDKDII